MLEIQVCVLAALRKRLRQVLLQINLGQTITLIEKTIRFTHR